VIKEVTTPPGRYGHGTIAAAACARQIYFLRSQDMCIGNAEVHDVISVFSSLTFMTLGTICFEAKKTCAVKWPCAALRSK
jgi:hypothetical protein